MLTFYLRRNERFVLCLNVSHTYAYTPILCLILNILDICEIHEIRNFNLLDR